MKITALTILKFNGDTADPTLLANASDVSNFGYFQRSSVREMIIFVSRTVGKRTPLQRRQSVEHEGKHFVIIGTLKVDTWKKDQDGC